MKHFKPNKTQQRMARVSHLMDLVYTLDQDLLKLDAIYNRLASALSHLSSRHHKRANQQLTIALALMKGL